MVRRLSAKRRLLVALVAASLAMIVVPSQAHATPVVPTGGTAAHSNTPWLIAAGVAVVAAALVILWVIAKRRKRDERA